MADTLPNIKLTANQWTDLYTASGVTTGTQLTIENIGETDVYIAVQQAQPLPGHNAYVIVKRKSNFPITTQQKDSGVWALSPSADGKLNVKIATLPQSSDFLFDVARGGIPGLSSLGFITRKTEVGTNFEDLWGESGSMVYPTSAETWEIVSTSPNDNAAGTGGRTALITSLDENWLTRVDVVSLNGTTPVTIPGLHIRPQQVVITESGSTGWNEGVVTVRDQVAPANTRNYIRAGESISVDGHFSVPADKRCYIAQTFTIYPKNVDGFSLVHVRDGGNPNASWITATSIPIYQNQVPFEVKGFFPLDPKTDLNSRAKVTSGTGDVTIIYEFILEDIL